MEGNSRENSPDWLRAFQAPERDLVTLSSGSESLHAESPLNTAISNQEETLKGNNADDGSIVKKGKHDQEIEINPKATEVQPPEQIQGEEAGEEKKSRTPRHSISQRLPLVFPEKVQRSKALVECDGDSVDLSGDIGAVGRILIADGSNGKQDLLLDLKGTIYKSRIVPSRTFCVVSVGQSEAKIEAIMNDFIQLEPQSNLFEAETMIEGTLDGFSFDSDDEASKIPESSSQPKDQNDEKDAQPKSKTKRKMQISAGVAMTKKAKVADKPLKKPGRKLQAAKRAKKSKK